MKRARLKDGTRVHFTMALVAMAAFSAPLACAGESPETVKPNPSGGSGGKTGTFANEQIEVRGKTRAYRLVVSKSIDAKNPAPLVFAFHGLLDSKDFMPLYSQLDTLAAEKNFILVYPNAVAKFWPLIPGMAKDDVAFFDALLREVSAKYNVDLSRVYVTGMSNGAYFSHLLASQRSDKIAAIAAHSGGLGALAFGEIKVKRKYPVLVIHGAEDNIVSVDEGRRSRDAYQKAGHAVEYIEIPAFGHLWAVKSDINSKIWKFFSAHPLQ